MSDGLELAIKSAGSQSNLARAIGKTPQLISYWHRKIGRVPAEYVPDVERVTGIPRHLLRPDLYSQPGPNHRITQGIDA
ncbi:MAG: YdaS family helix-turn-helix protein [Hyphomicrobiales bacterium]|nr:YdaS family helix-turn-helix protein [Hyphomicrobiales bacterium]